MGDNSSAWYVPKIREDYRGRWSDAIKESSHTLMADSFYTLRQAAQNLVFYGYFEPILATEKIRTTNIPTCTEKGSLGRLAAHALFSAGMCAITYAVIK